jgi:hypothetical protein
MTDKQLAELNIHPDKTSLTPNRYWCNETERHINIPRSMTRLELHQDMYDTGFINGVKEGKNKKVEEFNNVLRTEL